MTESIYYHGGVPGLRVGGYILPPCETGAQSVADVMSTPPDEQAEVEQVHRRDPVYITTERGTAELWACFYPTPDAVRGGDVYRVVPEGDMDPDPDWRGEPGVSVCAPRARIVGIVATGVRRSLAGRLVAEFG